MQGHRWMPAVAVTSAAAISAAPEKITLTWRTATITQCFAFTFETPSVCNGHCVRPFVQKPVAQHEPITVQIQAPSCNSCGCDACAHTIAYTTTYDSFCSTGLSRQVYAVTETYSGVEAKPTVASLSVPLGFTAEVQTCTTCGDKPVTATITYPVPDAAYITGISGPFPAPPGAKSYEINMSGSLGASPSQDGDDAGAGFASTVAPTAAPTLETIAESNLTPGPSPVPRPASGDANGSGQNSLLGGAEGSAVSYGDVGVEPSLSAGQYGTPAFSPTYGIPGFGPTQGSSSDVEARPSSPVASNSIVVVTQGSTGCPPFSSRLGLAVGSFIIFLTNIL
ncbi:hypothetical protein CGCF415_v008772 [Colletotrichum fructicola]|uniref:Uncharacterized protein n=1 Tax=Colletotrichum fructicola (strain Nara gc5) TaxID=1213859 RepID=A0A7J6II17_COLFN|nr:uncharacterized protein CGMCC3_g15309 [Colletotrichum fructicola]KAF4476226.1 hypothetical protein CGGC5_v014989 [Colletotrichum fructicola Nara gc5]KAE9568562.1 hypothetical protein CGMCC3_g15309 [Colletotrichum fructicola]KAF4885491.1 hypothetical protein CGCFRS4_v011881 [Colletotrichum fructicola]KAF4904064.1 hypothetical protein CGCF415_v008772 [Colletotrichum fructicola]KAF4929872.1 hypothetical protein CGCF245_v011957 [Colletotrichum fructicola]